MTNKEVQKFHEDSKTLAMLYKNVLNANPEKKNLKYALERLVSAK